jgi:hypothetical protein
LPRTKVVLYQEDDGTVPLMGVAVVVSHGLTKEDVVPDREIELAIQRKARFEKAPQKHSFLGER